MNFKELFFLSFSLFQIQREVCKINILFTTGLGGKKLRPLQAKLNIKLCLEFVSNKKKLLEFVSNSNIC